MHAVPSAAAQLDPLAVLDALGDPAVVLGTDLHLRAANAAARRLLGLSPADPAGSRQLADLLAPDEHERIASTALARASELGSWEGDATLCPAGSGAVPVRLRLTRVAGGDGAADETFVLVARDLSPLRRLEQELAESRRMEAVGRLAGGVAHDFNNILTAIIGVSELLLAEMPEGSGHHEDVAEIRGAADRAATLTRQLLTYSRRQMPQPRVVGANDVLRSAETLLRRVVGPDVALVLDLAPDAGHVRADVSQLEHVLVQLATNAREAMPTGGALHIATRAVRRAEATMVAHGLLPAGAFVEVSVRDSGAGMDAETLRRCFEPFFTTKTQARDQGAGLGLSVAFGLVRQSGGHIGAESEPGAGTTITIWLPRHAAGTPAYGVGVVAQDPAASAHTVLLVEDDESVRRVAAKTLRRRNYEVLEAAGGAEAIAIADAYPGKIHLLLTDVVMPQMSGAELARELLRSRPKLRILYASGGAEPSAGPMDAFERLKASYIQKPFSMEMLEEKVREALVLSS